MLPVAGWTIAYGGDVRTGNAFSKNEPLVLRTAVTQRERGDGRMQIFFAFSPPDRARRWKRRICSIPSAAASCG